MILLAYLAAGLLLGAAYFQTGRWTTERLIAARSTATTVALILARFLLLGVALTLISREGALPLLVAALGVFIARAAILRRTGRAERRRTGRAERRRTGIPA